MSRVLLAFDKFRGTATRTALHNAVGATLRAAGHTVSESLLSDGGEGSLESLGGANQWTTVTGPLGERVNAGWRTEGNKSFIEMAQASGLAVVGGGEFNEPMAADSYGTGELIRTAIKDGATQITVFLGGSATTDGGLGALRALPHPAKLRSIELTVGADVETLFTDAARLFAAQKGASPAQVQMLTRRLEALVEIYMQRYGVDVSLLRGAGAAGGLAGGLAAVGAGIESGFELLAEAVGLDTALHTVDLVITGEGFCDTQSFAGKVVGGVARWAALAGVPTLAIVGDTDLTPAELLPGMTLNSLAEAFGQQQPGKATAELVAQVALSQVSAQSS